MRYPLIGAVASAVILTTTNSSFAQQNNETKLAISPTVSACKPVCTEFNRRGILTDPARINFFKKCFEKKLCESGTSRISIPLANNNKDQNRYFNHNAARIPFFDLFKNFFQTGKDEIKG